MKKILSTLIISVFFLSVVIPVSVFALDIDTNYIPLTDVPGFADATSAKNPGGVLKTLFNLSIGIGGILAVIMLIFAGFKYMYEESIFGKGKAKEQITNAFFGLLLILGSYIILRTINSDLLRINLLLPKGDGKLATLVVKEKASQEALHKAAMEATARLRDIQKIEDDISQKDKSIKSIEDQLAILKQKPDTEANRNAIKELEEDKVKQETVIIKLREEIAIKKIDNLAKTSSDIVSVGRQNLFDREVSNVNSLLEKDPVKAAGEVRTSLQKLSANTDTQMNGIAKRIEEAQALSLTGDAAKQRDAFVLSAQQNVSYLSASKNILNDTYATIDTVGLSGSLGGGTVYQKFDRVIEKYSGQISGFESIGRKDLATQLKKDLEGATQLMKIRQANNCASKTPTEKASLTLCKP